MRERPGSGGRSGRRPLPWGLGLAAACVTAVSAGCGGIPPEPFVVADAASSKAAARTTAEALAPAFAQLGPNVGADVAIAWAPVGEPHAVQQLGSVPDEDAWSAIKVPIALAAAQDGRGDRAREAVWTTEAISMSDNRSAARLWSALGSRQEAAAAVEGILRRAGDTRTEVAEGEQGESRGFGRTAWSVADAARFAANLPCEREAGAVLDPMRRLAPEHRWGLPRLPGGAPAAKGGWGPSSHGYLVRQVGVVGAPGGASIALSLAVHPHNNSHTRGTAAMDAVATWIAGRLTPADGGRCPGS